MELKKRERIISDLEHCKFGKDKPNCEECNYKPWTKPRCWQLLCGDALALIKELTEEIKDLEEDYDRVYEQAEADIHGNMADGGTSCHWCMDKTKVDTVKRMQKRLKDYLKEVADREIGAGWIDVIAEEMLEEKSDG